MNYQLTYIIPSDVADLKTLEEIIVGVNKTITDADGVIKAPINGLADQAELEKSTEELEKIKASQNIRIFKHRLGYPIKKVSYGFYVSVIYELPEKNQSAMSKKITAEIKLNKKITRFAITKYNLDIFAEQSSQKEKTKNIKIAEKPKKEKQKSAQGGSASGGEIERLQAIINEAVQEKKKKKEIILDEKPKKSKKTEIEELDEKLEQILNA